MTKFFYTRSYYASVKKGLNFKPNKVAFERATVCFTEFILRLRFSYVPYSLYRTYENLSLKMFNETSTESFPWRIGPHWEGTQKWKWQSCSCWEGNPFPFKKRNSHTLTSWLICYRSPSDGVILEYDTGSWPASWTPAAENKCIRASCYQGNSAPRSCWLWRPVSVRQYTAC